MLTPIGRSPAPEVAARKHWAAAIVLAVALLLYLFAGLSLGSLEGGDAMARKILPGGRSFDVQWELPKGTPPTPEPLAFRAIAPQDALAINAAVPISTEANPAASPFLASAVGSVDRMRSIDCLTAAVYYEAAIETTDGQRAVAQVVLNRLRHPAYPKSVCGVVFQGSERRTGCQFTFTCDGSLGRTPSQAGWARARRVAEEALAGTVYKPVGWATHYHTNWVVPYWSSSLTKLANVGTHIFYRWEGGWGRPAAFRHAYAGAEPEVGKMGALSSVPPTAGALDGSLMADVTTLPAGVTPDDLKGRAVIRRYEPLRAQSVATRSAELAKADVPQSMRWALTGDPDAPKGAALGSKPAAAPAAGAAKPAAGAAAAAK